MSSLPLVSIVVPCRNEKTYIKECVESIASSDYPKGRLEILVVDGMSDDGTREILQSLSESHPYVQMLDNPQKVTPAAFNIGVQHARGEFVMIMSAHATYADDAISKCIKYSQEYDADNVGGIWRIHPRRHSFIDSCTIHALSHPFGVGDAHYRTMAKQEPTWVDTAAYGCYRRKVFEDIGLFNEMLVRGQDMEFNLRLKRAGGKTLLAPDVVINYYARSDLVTFCKHSFRNGLWAVLPFLYSNVVPVSLRHLVPGFFVIFLIVGSLGAIIWPAFKWAFLTILSIYFILNICSSVYIALRKRDWRFLFTMPIIFLSLHLSYGLGSLWGVARSIKELFKRKVSRFVRSAT